jgi:K+-sensing histidine kinase KdpD
MAKAKNVVQSLTEIRDLMETAYNQLKTAMVSMRYEDLESLRKTMIDVIIKVNDVIDTLELDAVVDAITELDALERVGDRNDGNQ